MKNDDITTTSTENLAVLGWAAPNSFDTLTLHKHTLHVKTRIRFFIFIFEKSFIIRKINKYVLMW